MSDALYAASHKQGAGCFPWKAADGSYSRKLSNIEGVIDLRGDEHLVCMEDFWPNQSMQSCLAPIVSCPKSIKVPHEGGLYDHKSFARHRRLESLESCARPAKLPERFAKPQIHDG